MPADLQTHRVEEVTYKADQFNVKGLCLTPFLPVKRIVVYLRGGKGQVGRVRLARMLQFLNKNTLVFAPYYRGNNGSEGQDDFAGDDLNDVTSAMRILTARYPQAFIHFVGFSRGGIQGLLTFQKVNVDSYIIWGGVSDLRLMYEERVDLRNILRRMVGHPKKAKEAYRQRDALAHIQSDAPPILIVHGGKDKQVGIHQAYVLETHLKEVGATYKTFYQMQEGHVPRPQAMKDVLKIIQSWMANVEAYKNNEKKL